MSSLTCYSYDQSNQPSAPSSDGWESAYFAPNNIYYPSPARMSDGRIGTNWQPDALINQNIQKREGIRSNWEYRQFLQKQGVTIRQINQSQYIDTMGVPASFSQGNTPSDNVPHRFKGTFDTSKPGFGYCNSDLKNPYLTREQLNARLVAPSITPPAYYKS